MGPVGSLVVPCAPSSPGTVRRLICADLAGLGVSPVVVDDAALVASELVTNAMRHARPLTGDSIRVAWEVHERGVLLAVTDGGGGRMPRVRPPSRDATGGRGLSIVDRLAVDWGVERATGRTTVWAELGPQASARGLHHSALSSS